MKICLKTSAKQLNTEPVIVRISERLPMHIHLPCDLSCKFQVDAHHEYYLVTLNVTGTLELVCQRCVAGFQYEYSNQTQVAVCQAEDVAENLMTSYECIVSKSNEIDLTEILTDELHLFCPEKHLNTADCDDSIQQYVAV